ncbi:ABC transporter substrate-binding protein [Nakamurella sp. YIM 132087]|uniref:ABC transporter substrate-binding protein n=1 Tax=Nakamurella alba TaxID=2665158 RepID=A0A7K1FIF0_9ACTN|nr:ABC transporter substrate-binding protein [Nakamurella alba]MTD13860.1 ABC transporter substrate-binding protein [Nakamurella alba]
MRLRTKSFALLAAVALTAAACGSDSSTTTSSSTAAPTTSASAATSAPTSAESSSTGASTDASSGGSETSPAGGSDVLPAEVKATFLGDLTGAAAFCGGSARTGIEQAVNKVNEDKMLGDGVTLSVDFQDTGSDPKQAATQMSQIAGTDTMATLIGCASAVGQGTVPVAQQAGVPVIAMQSGTQAILDAGNYVFRTTAPQSTYHGVQVDYYAAQGAKTAAMVYQSDNPTLTELAEKIYPDLLAAKGIELISTEAFQGENFDFSALASKVVGENPDVVFLMGQGTPNVTVATQLLQQGFEGRVGGSAGFANGVLEPLGADANGFTWPTDFNPASPEPSTQAFVQYYTEKTGKAPDAFAAESWDTVMLLVAGLNKTTDYTRAGLRDGIEAATQDGLDGAVGPITFENRDARIGGLLVEWEDGATKIVE